MARIRPSAWIYLTVSVLAVVNGLFDIPQLRYVTPALIAIFVVLEFSGVARIQRWIALVLGLTGVAIAATKGQAWQTLVEAIWRVQIFALLWFAVTWLQFPAKASPSLRAARAMALSQPPGRRHLTLSLAVHGLGGFLNLAGLSLLSSIVESDRDPVLKRRFTVALTQAFTSISGWSPVFIALPVVLVVLPGLRWHDLVPLGLISSATLLAASWLFDRVVYRQHVGTPHSAVQEMPPRTWSKLLLIVSTMILPVLSLVEGAKLSIPVSLALVGPIHALVWWSLIVQQSHPETMPRRLVGEVLQRLPSLRGEIVIFVGATIFGVGVATVVTPEVVGHLVGRFDLTAPAGIAMIALIIAGFGLAGLHPVVPVFLIGEVLPPEVLHMEPWTMGITMILVWGLTVTMSPFSGITLYMMRASGVSNYRLAYVWNLPFAVMGICIVVGLIILFHYIAQAI